ncbi:hypothetical protein FLONG3_10947 [Fusarium longipes]|uniref:Uncharacterized protein n=1 Tax=Fusarium longipes TaxID=694270 RepID=A0A395RJC5_9HYPO|nr:hypothetical protein FLONG3_10947 [Fusarium longipes]
MPDFRPLFVLAHVLTCSCFGRPKKVQHHQVRTHADNVRPPPGQEEQDCPAADQNYGISPSPSAMLPHPDEFEDIELNESVAAGTGMNENKNKSQDDGSK